MSHRVFICCCKGFFRDENRDELYQLLEVDRQATPSEIKRAYRNKSLQMHPDKLNQRGQEVTEEDRANFQKMKAAYDVLSDPQKRELYDQLGETGMMMMEDPFAAREKMFHNFLKMGTRDRLRLVVFVLIAVGAVLLWPILFCLKVDDELSASWVALWIPLWIYDALGLYYYVYLVSTGPSKPPDGMAEGWTDPDPLSLRLLSLFKWILLVAFQILLTLRLDDIVDYDWAVVGAPLLVWMVIHLLTHVYEATRPIPWGRTEESMLDDDDDSTPDAEKRQLAIAKRLEARMAVPKDVMWILQLVFIILRLDDQIGWSWWAVFFPTWLVMAAQVAKLFLTYITAKALTVGTEGKSEEDLSEEERVKIMAASQLYAQAVSSCCCWTFMSVTVILAVAAIAGAQYSTFVIFIPQFTIAGLVVCCLTCVICCLRSDPDEEFGTGVVDLEHGRTPGGAGVPPNIPPSYGTYNPPPMGGGGGGDNGTEGRGGAVSPTMVVVPMPPPTSTNTAAIPAQDPAVPRPPVQTRSQPAPTPAPDSQEDGGID